MRRDERERAGSRDLVLGTVHKNASGLLGLARRHSLCSTAQMHTTAYHPASPASAMPATGLSL